MRGRRWIRDFSHLVLGRSWWRDKVKPKRNVIKTVGTGDLHPQFLEEIGQNSDPFSFNLRIIMYTKIRQLLAYIINLTIDDPKPKLKNPYALTLPEIKFMPGDTIEVTKEKHLIVTKEIVFNQVCYDLFLTNYGNKKFAILETGCMPDDFGLNKEALESHLVERWMDFANCRDEELSIRGILVKNNLRRHLKLKEDTQNELANKE